jgi:hypothetical protein
VEAGEQCLTHDLPSPAESVASMGRWLVWQLDIAVDRAHLARDGASIGGSGDDIESGRLESDAHV